MSEVNFVEVTEANGNRRMINVLNISLVEEYQSPDYNMIYMNINGADGKHVIIYVQDSYDSILAAIKDVLNVIEPGE